MITTWGASGGSFIEMFAQWIILPREVGLRKSIKNWEAPFLMCVPELLS